MRKTRRAKRQWQRAMAAILSVVMVSLLIGLRPQVQADEKSADPQSRVEAQASDLCLESIEASHTPATLSVGAGSVSDGGGSRGVVRVGTTLLAPTTTPSTFCTTPCERWIKATCEYGFGVAPVKVCFVNGVGTGEFTLTVPDYVENKYVPFQWHSSQQQNGPWVDITFTAHQIYASGAVPTVDKAYETLVDYATKWATGAKTNNEKFQMMWDKLALRNQTEYSYYETADPPAIHPREQSTRPQRHRHQH
jgi:hypothetical protein